MVIDIKKKYLFLVAGIIVILSAAFIVFNSIRNENYEKNVKVCQENIYKLYFMSTLAASDIQTTWQEYIFDDKKYMDKKTGKFYSSPYDLPADADEQYCYDFNDAIVAKVSFLQNRKAFVTMDSLYTATKNLLKELTPAPKKYKDLHEDINELFHTAEAMYNCAILPQGNLQSYTSSINELYTEYTKQSSKVDIIIGELDEKKKIKVDFEGRADFFLPK